MSELATARTITLIPDPDATKQAERNASLLGSERCWIIDLPAKVDDMLVEGTLKPGDFLDLTYTARKI